MGEINHLMEVPKAYVLSRHASPALIRSVIAAFGITPIDFVLVSRVEDIPLAFRFGSQVLKTETDVDALSIALENFTEQNLPSLVIGGWAGAGAVYENGRLEVLPWPEADLMPN